MILISEEADKYLYALGIFLFFLLFKTFFRKTILKVLENLSKKTITDIDDEIVRVLKKPVDLLFIIVGFKIASSFLDLPASLSSYFQVSVQSLLTFTFFWIAFRILSPISSIMVKSHTKLRGKELGKDLANLITKALQVIIFALGFITILQEWGYNITGFLASLGLMGMAIALAAKDTVANLFGSLVIFSDKPFRIGDWIKTPDVEGVVEQVGIRSTKVRTFAQAIVSVPNATLANSSILNWSRMGKRRIKTTLGLTYSTNNEQMQNIVKDIKKMLKEDEDIHQDTIYIYFTEFEASSLSIFCYFFTKSTVWAEFMRVKEKINFKMIQIVERNKASFAFPSTSIYLEKQNEELN